MTSITPELNESMQRDAATLLYGNAVAGITISAITSSFLAFAFNNPDTSTFQLIWWCGMSLLLTARMADVIWWKTKLHNTKFDGQKAVNRFILGVNPTAIMWSIYLVYMTIYNNGIELTTSIIAVGSMAGGSATVLSGHKKTALFYSFILLAPGSLGLIVSDIFALKILGILGFSFCIVMILISKKSADFTLNTIMLKNENLALIQEMEEKVKQRTQKIYELSNLDPLTGLYNRAAFLSHLKAIIEQSSKKSAEHPQKNIALLFIDLDNFKNINDSIGHKAGDQILRETSGRLKQENLNNALVCRWGGDEFLIALPNTGEESAIKQSLQLIKELSAPHCIDNSILTVGATIGIALYPDHATTEDNLIQSADMAMYFQKKKARSTVGVFSEQMEKLYSHELYLKNELTKAIDNQQLRLVFQPLVLSSNHHIFAFEALLRWQVKGENITPDEFIPIAEQYGLIHEIGAWVLQHACMEASRWERKLQLAISVNVSVIQFKDDNFINIVENALSTSKLPAELLHIEITESVFSADTNSILNQIKRLQALGIKVSIDDFGTGYSSLSVMQDLAVNTVKIDRSFVNNLNGNGHAIISAVMDIASSLNFLVVAEGVETEEQAQELTKLGVHFLQGFYFSKPIETVDIPDFLNSKMKGLTPLPLP
ncbi:EAL domain-containing protein [Colwellia sp. 4_MG-2023]|uniref:putative bifunctional diguanylate cyclase/phosphodiesterase n=1 Tax=unclassified Colwellia TaxID=196834 RepID=UPI0026E2CA2A|nr:MULTISPECIES: EAL domain-containing protein [unclassified Colwellia]MDO6506577.1 EAL domain-containing protein [Colwellia sp. 5_MG-2023]MDO6555064.1 EAL domain-containing protein [Colwellia sp. 4_MG-2023]